MKTLLVFFAITIAVYGSALPNLDFTSDIKTESTPKHEEGSTKQPENALKSSVTNDSELRQQKDSDTKEQDLCEKCASAPRGKRRTSESRKKKHTPIEYEDNTDSGDYYPKIFDRNGESEVNDDDLDSLIEKLFNAENSNKTATNRPKQVNQKEDSIFLPLEHEERLKLLNRQKERRKHYEDSTDDTTIVETADEEDENKYEGDKQSNQDSNVETSTRRNPPKYRQNQGQPIIYNINNNYYFKK